VPPADGRTDVASVLPGRYFFGLSGCLAMI
jgi:hypothetical protein